MPITEITAKKNETSVTCSYDFGSDVQEAIAKFGADVVFSQFKASAVITAQAVMRRLIEKGTSAEKIQETINAWKPGVALERSAPDPVASLKSKWANMSPEEQAKAMAELKDLFKPKKD